MPPSVRMEPDEAVRAILHLDPADQQAMLTTLSPPEAADLIEDAPDEQAADLIERLAPADAAAIVTEMQSDEQADLIADLRREEADAILGQLEPDMASEVRAMADYADDVAGGLMITEYLRSARTRPSAPPSTSSSSTPKTVTTTSAATSTCSRRWGAWWASPPPPSWRPRHGACASPMSWCRRSSPASDDQAGRPARVLRGPPHRGRAGGRPRGRLLGVARRTAVLDAIAERAEREMLRMRGIVGGDEVRSLPTRTRARRRLSWLLDQHRAQHHRGERHRALHRYARPGHRTGGLPAHHQRHVRGQRQPGRGREHA